MPKKTLEAIVETGNDYLVKVKGNQPTLLKKIEEKVKFGEAVERYEDKEITRDRYTIREVEVFELSEDFDESWKGARSVIGVKRSGMRGDKSFKSQSYYLTSLFPKARRIPGAIRKHWGIENRLHWVKDVILEEDVSPQKAGAAPINLALLKSWVLTLLRLHGFEGIKEGISRLSNNLDYLLSFCF